MKNFHTHTYRCKHARGDIMDYAMMAQKAGIKALGFSDHTPLPDNRWPEIRMDMLELEEYLSSIDKAKEVYNNIRIYKGLECEYDQVYEGFFRDELLGPGKVDYLIGGVHFFPSDSGWEWCVASIRTGSDLKKYAEYYVTSMKSGLFNFMAHPDFFGVSYPHWDANSSSCARYILEAARDLKIPIEINVAGLVKEKIQTPHGERPAYPIREFWMLAAEYGVASVVSSDAHRPEDLAVNLRYGFELAKELGVELVDPESVVKK